MLSAGWQGMRSCEEFVFCCGSMKRASSLSGLSSPDNNVCYWLLSL